MLKTVSFAAAAFIATSASAATIVYNVSQTIGLGSVVGTIQTNGALGTLAATDITGFNLQVSGPGASILLTDADSIVRSVGSNLTAINSGLSFDYGGPSGYLLFQFGSFGTGMRYYCNASTSGDCFQGASAIPVSFDSPSAQVEQRTGNQIIATVAGAVPEPASWALMLTGFGMVGAALRRRTAVHVSA